MQLSRVVNSLGRRQEVGENIAPGELDDHEISTRSGASMGSCNCANTCDSGKDRHVLGGTEVCPMDAVWAGEGTIGGDDPVSGADDEIDLVRLRWFHFVIRTESIFQVAQAKHESSSYKLGRPRKLVTGDSVK